MNWLKRLSTYRILKKHGLPDSEWLQVTQKLPLLEGLSTSDRAKLRILSTLLIYHKTFTAVQGLELTVTMKITIAAQACLEVLELGFDSFNGWHEIVIYPGAFKVERQAVDEIGLVHSSNNALSGEAWMKGPVILSWEDIERDSYHLRAGHNVIIHEFAHKLDMLNGRANGMPPLHPDMPITQWTDSLSKAYKHLTKRLDHYHSDINLSDNDLTVL